MLTSRGAAMRLSLALILLVFGVVGCCPKFLPQKYEASELTMSGFERTYYLYCADGLGREVFGNPGWPIWGDGKVWTFPLQPKEWSKGPGTQ